MRRQPVYLIGQTLQPHTDPGAGGRLVHCPFQPPNALQTEGHMFCAAALSEIGRGDVSSQPHE
jgi:hypothetical protein